MPDAILAAMSRIPAFAALPEAVKSRIGHVSGLQHIDAGATLFREGGRPHFVYGIVEGHVALATGTDEDVQVADLMGPGDVVLAPPALLDLPYMVSGKATQDVQALLIPAAEFRALVDDVPAFAAAIARMMATHWRLLLKHVKAIKSQDVDTRLIGFLLDRTGVAKGEASVPLPSSKRHLASHLGMTPETLSRALRRLRPAGVETHDGYITIHDVERLASLIAQARTGNVAQGAR